MLETVTPYQLTQIENQFRSAFEFSAIGMALANADGKLIEVNNSLCKITGYLHTELLQHTFQEITHPDDLETDLHLLQELIDEKRQSYQIEKRYIHRDGHTVWALLSVSMVKDNEGKIIHFIKQIQDISGLKEKAHQLIQSENQFRSAFEFSAIGMALANTNGRLIKVNNSLCKIIGYSAGDLLTHTFQDITHPDDLESDLHLLQELKEGKRETYQMEKRYIHQDGHFVWTLLAVSMMKDDEGKIIHFIKQIQDITTLKENEKELISLNESISEANKELINKNEELKQFAYVASHDLQEPLRMVTSFLSKIETKYQSLLDEKGKQYFRFAIDGASRMRLLIIGILNYTTIDSHGNSVIKEVDLNVLVKDILTTNMLLLNEQKVEVILDELPVIKANEISMQQLFSNLITNAIKYQLPGNTPIVKISVEDNTDHWQFSIADNGIGIDARGLDKIFNIFQRLHTQDQYSGTGIGLAICKKIITHLNGKIWAESTPGNGSTFFFTITK